MKLEETKNIENYSPRMKHNETRDHEAGKWESNENGLILYIQKQLRTM